MSRLRGGRSAGGRTLTRQLGDGSTESAGFSGIVTCSHSWSQQRGPHRKPSPLCHPCLRLSPARSFPSGLPSFPIISRAFFLPPYSLYLRSCELVLCAFGTGDPHVTSLALVSWQTALRSTEAAPVVVFSCRRVTSTCQCVRRAPWECVRG